MILGTGLPTYLPVRLVTTSSGGLTKEKAGAQKDAMSRSAALENMSGLQKYHEEVKNTRTFVQAPRVQSDMSLDAVRQ